MRAPMVVIVAVSLALAGCAEREDIAERARAYQGKADSRAWDNAPLPYEPARWTQGDRASWEAGIKTRQLTQHEYKRIGQ